MDLSVLPVNCGSFYEGQHSSQGIRNAGAFSHARTVLARENRSRRHPNLPKILRCSFCAPLFSHISQYRTVLAHIDGECKNRSRRVANARTVLAGTENANISRRFVRPRFSTPQIGSAPTILAFRGQLHRKQPSNNSYTPTALVRARHLRPPFSHACICAYRSRSEI